MVPRDKLRPFERAVLRLRDSGLSPQEIGERFNRSPEFIERVISWTQLENRPGRDSSDSREAGLSALERRVLRWRSRGVPHDELAGKFRRSETHIRRVEGWAYLKKAIQLLD